MNEKEMLIAESIEDVIIGIQNLQNQLMGMEAFIRDNFRHYNGYSASTIPYLNGAKQKLERARQLSSTNKDNAHKLEKEFTFDSTVGMDEDGNYRRGPVPNAYQVRF